MYSRPSGSRGSFVLALVFVTLVGCAGASGYRNLQIRPFVSSGSASSLDRAVKQRGHQLMM